MDQAGRLSAAEASRQAGYDPACFDEIAAVEDHHFWFRARSAVIAAAASSVVAARTGCYRILEVGCGAGQILRTLRRACPGGHVFGMDLFAEGLRYARARSAGTLVQGDLSQPPFSDVFHIAGAFDVIEHIPDDLSALRLLHGVLLPGGSLLVTVPAHPALWSYFDEYSHHCRRYTEAELRGKLLEAGFHVEYLTPYMASIFPLLWVARRLTARAGGKSMSVRQKAALELRVIPGLNGILTAVLTREAVSVSKRRRLPFGSSLLAVARKPSL